MPQATFVAFAPQSYKKKSKQPNYYEKRLYEQNGLLEETLERTNEHQGVLEGLRGVDGRQGI